VVQTAQRGVDLISMYIRVLRKTSKYPNGRGQFVLMNWIPVILRMRRGGRFPTVRSLRSAVIDAAIECATAQNKSISINKAHDVPCRLIHLRLWQKFMVSETPGFGRCFARERGPCDCCRERIRVVLGIHGYSHAKSQR
jgi:hypothetical protein